MTTIDILAFGAENRVAVRKLAADFRAAGVTEACVLATLAIAAGGRTFARTGSGAGRAVRDPARWLLAAARKILEREYRSVAFFSLDEGNSDGITLGERFMAPEMEPNVWQRADDESMAAVCDALECGTVGLAIRLRVTRRRGQQIFKEATAAALEGRQADLFCSGAVRR